MNIIHLSKTNGKRVIGGAFNVNGAKIARVISLYFRE